MCFECFLLGEGDLGPDGGLLGEGSHPLRPGCLCHCHAHSHDIRILYRLLNMLQDRRGCQSCKADPETPIAIRLTEN